MRAQIMAGLGFSVSGLPYWTMDSGGFSVPGRFANGGATPEARDEWRELNTRWFQFTTFVRSCACMARRRSAKCGVRRRPERRLRAQLKFDRLRYRLLLTFTRWPAQSRTTAAR